MRIDNNYKGEHRDILQSLLDDLQTINNNISNKIYIDKQDYHNEYSCERVEPCPDYYGLYSLRIENQLGESLEYEPMTIEELDSAICLLSKFCEFCV